MDKRKQSLYFPEDMLNELKKEAERVDRSLSWVVQRCIKAAMKDIKAMPSTTLPEPIAPPPEPIAPPSEPIAPPSEDK